MWTHRFIFLLPRLPLLLNGVGFLGSSCGLLLRFRVVPTTESQRLELLGWRNKHFSLFWTNWIWYLSELEQETSVGKMANLKLVLDPNFEIFTAKNVLSKRNGKRHVQSKFEWLIASMNHDQFLEYSRTQSTTIASTLLPFSFPISLSKKVSETGKRWICKDDWPLRWHGPSRSSSSFA
jgi:hypothetical protein